MHNYSMKKSTVYTRVAEVISKPGDNVTWRDVAKAFRPKFKISQSTVSKWARGGGIEVDKAKWFCNKHKISGWWLLTGNGPKLLDRPPREEDDVILEIYDRLSDDAREDALKYAEFRATH